MKIERKHLKKRIDLERNKEKATLASSGVVRSGSSSTMRRPRVSGTGLFDNPLFKFLGLSALAGLVEFIPRIIEFVETLPERINKFFTEDIPEFIGKKFEEFKSFVGGFFTDRFNEVKQFLKIFTLELTKIYWW